MNLRKFAESDRAAFLSMCEDFYHSGAADTVISVSQMESSFDQIMQKSPYIQGYIIEADDGGCAGYGIVFPFYSNEGGGLFLMLEEIYVKPAFRSQKLGSFYLENIKEASGLPVKGFKLEICRHNDGARRLYERHGFKPLAYGEMIRVL